MNQSLRKNTQINILRSLCLIWLCTFFFSYSHGIDLFSQLRQQNATHSNVFMHAAASGITSMRSSEQRPYCVSGNEATIRIYMYHYVRPTHRDPAHSGIWNNSVTPGTFDKHMSYLHQLQTNKEVYIGFLSEMETRQTSGCYPHKNIIILTSDDGWRDNYGYLFPTAVKYGIKFNLGIIYEKTKEEFERVDPFMTIAEVQEIANHPLMEIQSHSMTHADLRSLSYTNQAEEICFSKQGLERMLGIKINTFIAPYGGMTPSLPLIAKTCGYTYALSTKGGYVHPSELTSRPYDLERLRVTRNANAIELFGN